MKYHFRSLRLAIIKKLQITDAGEGVENTEHFCTVDRNVNWCSNLENSMKTPYKLKTELPHDPAILLLAIYLGHNNLKRCMHSYVCSHIVYNSWDTETILMSIYRWMAKEYVAYINIHIQFSSVTQSCLTLCDPMNRSKPGLPVHHQLPEFAQIHVHWVDDAIQPFQPLSSPSPPALNLSQHPGLFKLVSSLHQVAEVLEFHLQHQSFWRTSRADLL